MTCPLTTLENYFLRASGAEGYSHSFIGNLVDEILYYNAPEWVFFIIYVILALLVILYYIFYPPLVLADKLQQYKQVRRGTPLKN
jgi:dolichyl-phosphate-mannose--protein O-mannosyl transferase